MGTSCAWGSATCARLGCHRLQAHDPHQPLNTFAIDVTAFGFENLGKLAASEERHLEMQLVDASHQRELLNVGLDRLVVQHGPANAEQLALTSDGEWQFWLDHRATIRHRRCPSPRAKKSRSTVSSPIFLSSSSSRSLFSVPLPAAAPLSNASAARSMNSRFQV